MNQKRPQRYWITPLTLGSFMLCAGSGILLFFHINIGLVKLAHQWLSWIFVIGAGLHVAVNRKPLGTTIVKPTGALIVMLFLVVMSLSFMPLVEQPQSPVKKAMALVVDLPLRTLAEVSGRTDEELSAILAGHGIKVADQAQTLSALARENHQSPTALLQYLF